MKEQLKLKEAELKQKYEEDLQKKINQKENKLRQRYDNDVRNKELLIEQLKKKENEVTSLQQKFIVETSKTTTAIAERALVEKRLKDIQKIKEEQEQARSELQQKLTKAKTQTEFAEKRCKKLEVEKLEKEGIVQDLEKYIEDRRVTQVKLEARIKHLQEELSKKKEFDLAIVAELEQKREEKMRLAKEIEDLTNESKQTAIQAAERTKRLEKQLIDKEQEVIKLTAINEERAAAHKVTEKQLKDI